MKRTKPTHSSQVGGRMLLELQRRFTRGLFADEPRLRPYRENVLCGLAEALEALYPVCRRLVGDEFFREAGRRFARECPSRSADLNEYGAGLAEFFAGFEPSRALAYLPDVARLEWALHRTRLAPAPAELDLESLANVPEAKRGEVAFTLAANVALLASPYPIDRIWRTNQPDYTGEDRVDLAEGEVALLVGAERFGPVIERLEAAEFQVLAGLERGLSLERAVSSWPDTDEALANLLSRAVLRGWLAGIRAG